jgi:type I restriction enzyme R subunit
LAPQPEQQARGKIDVLLEAAGWHVCDASAANIHAARGVAIREFPLPGYGFADYLLYVDGKAAGVIEAKKEGITLTGVETLSDKYTKGLPAGLPCWMEQPAAVCLPVHRNLPGRRLQRLLISA